MDLWLKRVGNALYADGDDSACEFSKIPFGKTLRAEIKQPRNPAFHRLYFALCHRIASGIGSDAETISNIFKFATGHVDTIKTKSYGQVEIPKSISFSKMDNGQFSSFFEKCVVVCYEEWKIDPAQLEDLLVPEAQQKR